MSVNENRPRSPAYAKFSARNMSRRWCRLHQSKKLGPRYCSGHAAPVAIRRLTTFMNSSCESGGGDRGTPARGNGSEVILDATKDSRVDPH